MPDYWGRTISCIFVLAVAADTVSASLPSAEGATGLLSMRTAETLGTGEAALSLFGGGDSYVSQGAGANDSDVYIVPAFQFGLIDGLEVGLSAKLMKNIGSSNDGVSHVSGMGKYLLLGGRESGFGAALSAYGDLYTADSSDNIGSGDENYGAEVNLGWFSDEIDYHLSLGSTKTDIKTVTPAVSYQSDTTAFIAAGVAVRPLPALTLSLEANGNKKLDENNIVLMPGVRYRTQQDIVFSFGAGYGIPNDRSEPESRYLAGLSIVLGRPKGSSSISKMSRIESQLDEFDDHLDELTMKVEKIDPQVISALDNEVRALGHQVGQLESGQVLLREQLYDTAQQLVNMPGVTQPGVVRVSILNTSGIAGLADSVAQKLIQEGYEVISVKDVPEARRTQTRISYREGFSKSGVEIGHLLPETQVVYIKLDISEPADIEIALGTDLRSLQDTVAR